MELKIRRTTLLVCILFTGIFNLQAQKINVKMDRQICKLNQNILVIYQYDANDAVIKDLKSYTFEKVGGPNESISTKNVNGVNTYSYEVSYLFKATSLGKQILPQLLIESKGQRIMSGILEVEIVVDDLNVDKSKFKQYKSGHVFYISFPGYIESDAEEDNHSNISYQNKENDINGFVEHINKKSLNSRLGVNLTIDDFYKSVLETYTKEKTEVKITNIKSQKIGTTTFKEADVSYFDKENNETIYFFLGIAETDTTFYNMISQAEIDKKGKFKPDFQKILYSIKD